jgi:hypothetical protein
MGRHGRYTKDHWEYFDFDDAVIDPGPSPAGNPGPYLKVKNTFLGTTRHRIYPPWFVSDVIWVRETWMMMGRPYIPRNVVYKADKEDPRSGAWKPSIHMPRKFARIFLEIKEIRIQRIQEICHDDVQAEGCRGSPLGSLADELLFPALWDAINEKRGFPWKDNPWVWAITFERKANHG